MRISDWSSDVCSSDLVLATETSTSGPVTIEEGDIVLPDVLTDLQDRTQLTRRSLVTILTESGRLSDFKRNPQAFIELAAEVINRTKRLALVDGIKYQRVGVDTLDRRSTRLNSSH